jgi:predicted RecA/RadA family phage recombinase
MAKNYIEEGDVLNFIAGGGAVASGSIVIMGKRAGVALSDIPANGQGAVGVTGVWAISKVPADVVAQGDLLYWDAANSRLTTTAAGSTLAGYAAAPAAAGAATVNIKLNG